MTLITICQINEKKKYYIESAIAVLKVVALADFCATKKS